MIEIYKIFDNMTDVCDNFFIRSSQEFSLRSQQNLVIP